MQLSASAKGRCRVPASALTAEQCLALLATTPRRIGALTGPLLPAHVHAAPAPGEWSARDMLAHLRACDAVWGSCMRTIITQDRPTIRAINPTSWVTHTDYFEQAFQPL